MKEDVTDRELDKLMGKMLKDENPGLSSLDFTAKIMSRIEAHRPSSIGKYEPLISTKVWGALGLGFLLAVGYFFLTDKSTKGVARFNTIEWPQLQLSDYLTGLSDMFIPDTLMYGILVFTLLLYVQIFVLKRYMDNRF